METKLMRIAELAKSQPSTKFTTLAHLLNEDALKQCHHELPNNKATGVNRTTKEEYGENLDDNIKKSSYKTKTEKLSTNTCP